MSATFLSNPGSGDGSTIFTHTNPNCKRLQIFCVAGTIDVELFSVVIASFASGNILTLYNIVGDSLVIKQNGATASRALITLGD